MLLSKLLAVLPILPLALAAPAPASQAKRAVPSGFVTTNGKQFELDGQPFCFSGINAYWIPQFVKESQFRPAFERMQSIGVKVLRTWAFSMVTATPSYDLTYYQQWNGNSYSLNTGANGLERLDIVVRLAEEFGIKLILTFTNNWNDFGGMDMYLQQITGDSTYHSDFYVNPSVIQSYEAYVNSVVQRYKNSAAIFAWELANEPRSGGYPSTARPGFTADDLTKWVADRAAFVKSIDPNHMVAVGDEGYFNWKNSTDYIYDGDSGGDFEGTLRLPNIDFGTFHLYPEPWGKTFDWGNEYIQQHANAMNEIGKPVILEEFNTEHYADQKTILPQWIDKAIAAGLPGIMPWHLGAEGLDTSGSSVWTGAGADSMDLYPDKADMWALLQKLGDTMNKACPAGNPQPSTTAAPSSTAASSTSSAAASTSASTCTPVPKWGQCGGINYTGCKTCESGSTCTYNNDWYWQCI